MKKFCIGLFLAILVTGTVNVFAQPIAQRINVSIGEVIVLINGVPLQADSIVHNGVTYIPVRAYTNMLGYNLNFIESINTIYIWSRPFFAYGDFGNILVPDTPPIARPDPPIIQPPVQPPVQPPAQPGARPHIVYEHEDFF